MKRFAFFPGCLIPARHPAMEFAIRYAMPKLGIEIVDLEGTSCCPDPLYFKSKDKLSWLAVAARNLSIAEDLELDIFTNCSGCTATLSEAWHLLLDEELRAKVNLRLARIGREYRGTSRVKHIVALLRDEIGYDAIRESVKTPLEDLRVAIHYGCHLLKPSSIMAGDGHESAGDLPAMDSLGHGGRGHPGDVAIDHTGEFVEGDDPIGVFAGRQGASQIATEAFAAGEDVIGLDPTRRRAEPDGRKEGGDLLDRQLTQAVDHGPIPRPIVFRVKLPLEQLSRDRALAASRGTDDQPDFPGIVQIGNIDTKPLAGPIGQRHVEHAGDLLHAKRIEDGTVDLDFQWWHGFWVLGCCCAEAQPSLLAHSVSRRHFRPSSLMRW